MKNNFLCLFLFLFIGINFLNTSSADEQFIFDISEIEISNDGNLIIGSKGGKAVTNDGYEITAENFIFNKSKNILNVSGNVKFLDKNSSFVIFQIKQNILKMKK